MFVRNCMIQKNKLKSLIEFWISGFYIIIKMKKKILMPQFKTNNELSESIILIDLIFYLVSFSVTIQTLQTFFS